MHSFSIFIPTYNAEKWLPRCLDSIAKQVYPRDKVEVLVVDGGSTDRTLHIAQNYGARIFHHCNGQEQCAIDIFRKNATGDLTVMFLVMFSELYLFTEDDVLERLNACFQEIEILEKRLAIRVNKERG